MESVCVGDWIIRQTDVFTSQVHRDEKPGKKAFCTCGISNNQPFCDGSHKGTNFKPEIIELIEEKNCH